MKIAVTDLKDYNEGILRYEWLDLEECSTSDSISSYIDKFLSKRSKETEELHEEWCVSDYEEFVNLGEYPLLLEVERATLLSKEYGWEAVSEYYSMNGSFDDFEEAYNGVHDSEEEFAEELALGIYTVQELGHLILYIDWERYARELFINDYFSCDVAEGVVVFRRI